MPVTKLIAEIQKMQSRRGLSDQKLAEELGVNPSTLSLFKNGRRPLGGKLMKAITRKYPKLRKYIYRHIESPEEEAAAG